MRRGHMGVPFFFTKMEDHQLKERICRLTEEVIAASPAYFLVEVRIKPVNNVKVFLDADEGAAIDQLAAFNRTLYKKLEASGIFPEGGFSLEVSSPGIDEPLKMLRQYRKNAGRRVEVLLLDGAKKEGVLREVNEAGITLLEAQGKNKNQTTIETPILFSQIKHLKVCVVF